MGSDIKLIVDEMTQRRIKKQAYNTYQLNEMTYENIITVGIVKEIDYYGNPKNGLPPYGVKVKIEKDSRNFYNTEVFFPPLLPIHSLSLPQVGEEVWLIFGTVGSNSFNGFWISRANYNANFSTNALTQMNFDDLFDDSDKNTKDDLVYGVGYTKNDYVEYYDVEPQTIYEVPKLRVKPGDTVTHGRSNTHTFHTFDTKNKKGVVDIITEIDKPKKDFYKQEFHISKGSRVLLATKQNIDETVIKEDIGKEFHEKFITDGEDQPYVLIQSNKIRLVSPNGSEVNNIILAQKYEEWIRGFFDELIKHINRTNKYIASLHIALNTFADVLSKHTHFSGFGPTLLPIEGTQISKLNNDLASIESKRKKFEDSVKEINDRFDVLKETFSKQIGVN